MILEIVKYDAPVLRAKGAPVDAVTDEIKQLAEDMLETMRAANGVGLAAQQIGKAIQMAVIDVAGIDDRPSAMFINGDPVKIEDHMPMVLLNPELRLGADKEIGLEGCLSFPELTADIVRSAGVHCRAQLLSGEQVDFEASGLLARALQHEVDHLHGVLFIDRMNSATRAGLTGKLKRLKREYAEKGR